MSDEQTTSSTDETPGLVRVASDELLLLGARLHDDVALGVLYDRYGAEIYALALDTLHDSLLAEAVMQDVFLRCWRGEELYDVGHGTIGDWLLGIARRCALETLDARDPDGEAPTRVIRIDDSGLLAPEEPDPGARDRLLTRARAENEGDRASEAPTVAVPVDDLVSDEPALVDGPEDETPALADMPEDESPTLADLTEDQTPALVDVSPDEPPMLADVTEDETPTLAVAAPEATSDEHDAVGDGAASDKVVKDGADEGGDGADEGGDGVDDVEPNEQAAAARASEQRPPAATSPEALAAALAPIPPRRTGRQQPGSAASPPDRPARSGIKRVSILWGIALLFVIGSGLFVGAWSATGPHVSPDVTILSHLPGGRVLTLRGTGAPTASARVHTVDGGRRAELSVESLPPLPGGRVYQVWLAEAGQPVRSGGAFLVNRRGDAVFPLTMAVPIERLQAIFITQEVAPGTSAPSGGRLLEWTP